jgi:DNA repair protein RadC
VPTIREWPQASRPRERLLGGGASQLADDELLAILIGSGRPGRDALALARDLVVRVGGLHALARADARRLGLGTATAARVLAACELGRRAVAAEAPDERLDTPERAVRALAPRLTHRDREVVLVALLTRKQGLMGVVTAYEGNVAGASVRIGELFSEAVRRNAAAILLAHNHPSGDPEPSGDDIRTTRDAIAAGKLLGIPVIDHVVIGSAGRWTSLRERGLRFD